MMTVFEFREHKDKLFRFPKNGDDVRDMHDVIDSYTKNSYWLVAFAFVSIYIK